MKKFIESFYGTSNRYVSIKDFFGNLFSHKGVMQEEYYFLSHIFFISAFFTFYIFIPFGFFIFGILFISLYANATVKRLRDIQKKGVSLFFFTLLAFFFFPISSFILFVIPGKDK